MKEPQINDTESAFLKQIEDIDRRINELNEEKKALQRLLQRTRQKNLAIKDVTRKNSLDRIWVESKMLEILRLAGEAVSSKELYGICRATMFSLKETTFRSHLHRMKSRALIVPDKKRGWWKLPDQLR